MIFFYLLAWGNLSLKIESIMFTKQNIIVCHIYWIIILITLWTITGSLTNTLITLHKYFCWGSYSLREIFSRLFIKSLRQIWTFNSSPSVVFSNWSMRNLSLNDGKNYVPSESRVVYYHCCLKLFPNRSWLRILIDIIQLFPASTFHQNSNYQY